MKEIEQQSAQELQAEIAAEDARADKYIAAERRQAIIDRPWSDVYEERINHFVELSQIRSEMDLINDSKQITGATTVARALAKDLREADRQFGWNYIDLDKTLAQRDPNAHKLLQQIEKEAAQAQRSKGATSVP